MKKVSLFGVRYIFYSVVWSLVGDLMLALFCRSGNKKAAGIGMLFVRLRHGLESTTDQDLGPDCNYQLLTTEKYNTPKKQLI